MPKQIWILPELPMTPIGKIYKPALRILATRHAIELALSAAGLAATEVEIVASDTGTMIEVAAQHVQAAKQALLGMPVRYDIRAAAPAHPAK